MIFVAGYCRVSTDKDDQANSFQAQQRFFHEYIRQTPGWELYEIYADEGITGTSTKKRTEFNRMIRDAHEGKFQMIVTKEISRFSRNILDTLQYTRELKSMGVGVLFLTENLNTMHPESEMLMTFMGTIAQEESRRISIRVKWGQTRSMEQGTVFGTSLLGYDVKDGKLMVNREGAELVRLIFHKYGIERKGTSVICKELQNDGYHTMTGNPVWHPSHIIKILKNEKYVGDLVQKKTITPDFLTHAKKQNCGQEELVIIRNHHTPLITRELWDQVQIELRTRSKQGQKDSRPSNRYLFSGKIRCGNCGASFVSRKKTRKDETKVHRWCCYTAVSQGSSHCNVGKQLRDEDALNMLKAAVQSLNLDVESIIADVTAVALNAMRCTGQKTETAEQLQLTISRMERKKLRIMDAYCSGDISTAEMQMMKARCEQQLTALQSQLDAFQKEPEDPVHMIQDILRPILLLERESNTLYKNILDSITVFADRHMELRLRFLPQVFWFSEE